MNAEPSEEKAQYKRDPFLLGFAADNGLIDVIVGVVIYNDLLRSGRALELLDLPTSVCTDNGFLKYLLSAELAELHSVVHHCHLRVVYGHGDVVRLICSRQYRL